MNSTTLNDFEIMAPVGSRESLAAAIQAGADSIYFGIENLNMRARSANTFTIDDLREIAQTCDEHGMKSYLTVNTIIYDNDISLMRTIVDAAKAAGISAVIAADVAVMSYAREKRKEAVFFINLKPPTSHSVLSLGQAATTKQNITSTPSEQDPAEHHKRQASGSCL